MSLGPGWPLLVTEAVLGDSPYASTLRLPIQKLDLKVDVHQNTAIVRMIAKWKNVEDYIMDCHLILPCNGTVSSLQTLISSKDEMLLTGVLPNDDIKERCGLSIPEHTVNEEETNEFVTEKYMQGDPNDPYKYQFPDTFRCPINSVAPRDVVTVTVEWIQRLSFKKGKGQLLELPVHCDDDCDVNRVYPESATWLDICTIVIKLNARMAEITGYDSKSHTLELLREEEDGSLFLKVSGVKELLLLNSPKSTTKESSLLISNEEKVTLEETTTIASASELSAEKKQPWSRPFALTFKNKGISRSFTMMAMKKQDQISEETIDQNDRNPKTNIVLFLQPMKIPKSTFSRCIYILLDRSGSMRGGAYRETTEAIRHYLKNGLRSNHDSFNVIAFDHRSLTWRPSFAAVTDMNIDHCLRWLEDMTPEKGGTNLMYPLKQALTECNRPEQKQLPFIIFITDGSVKNEREICHFIQDQNASELKNKARIFTIGLGPHVNWFFLKHLALLGRGESIICHTLDSIQPKMKSFLKRMKTVVMSDITLECEGIDQHQLNIYPNGMIPDLYDNHNVNISIDIDITKDSTISQISKIKLKGYDPDLNVIELECPILECNDLPIDKLAAMEKLDYLSTSFWMIYTKEEQSSQKQAKELAQYSVALGLPLSGVTSMIALRGDQYKAAVEGLVTEELMSIIHDDHSEDEESLFKDDPLSRLNWMTHDKPRDRLKRNPKLLALAAVGFAGAAGAVAAGAAVIASDLKLFGDFNMTMGNFGFPDSDDFDFDGEGDCECGEDDDCCGDECCDDDCLIM